ncbi:maleylpyruvate isomerase N-terminal domain-containing protein [Kitasatospora cathayae]|uniref:Maleylpyruvate isomerase N-terminal domain-containing protein n=1 Tax=Kitasatospora cathayae TaxID=3004092 RepID=A0ABY7QEP2_9ACTN|nr:maleylpyruvate isomerase N-terminal domain-containing protein [Kitasatospora sp. HUAS 3-15]WBP90561.1 maleylpyruvate isomerase N-terminal domain-containing protein [Kitasatospora sp. HUAS 3-15]
MSSQNTAVNQLLTEAWASWAERGEALSAEDWDRPTRLSEWTVRDLYAHVAPAPAQFTGLREAVLDGPAELTRGADVLRTFNRPGGLAHTAAGHIAELAKEAAKVTEPAALIARFGVEGPAALAGIADLPPDTVVSHQLLGSVTVGALGEVALMEATVHLLDLIAAVGGPAPAEEALHFTRGLLAEATDPVAFIEAAAGRSSEQVLPIIR